MIEINKNYNENNLDTSFVTRLYDSERITKKVIKEIIPIE